MVFVTQQLLYVLDPSFHATIFSDIVYASTVEP